MSDWTWVLVIAFGLVLVWNLGLQSANASLQHQVALHAQEIRELQQKINGRYDNQSAADGCLGALLWITVAIIVALFLLSTLMPG